MNLEIGRRSPSPSPEVLTQEVVWGARCIFGLPLKADSQPMEVKERQVKKTPLEAEEKK